MPAKPKPYHEATTAQAIVQEWFADTWMQRWKGELDEGKAQLRQRRDDFPERVYRLVSEETRVTRTILVEQNEPGKPRKVTKPDIIKPSATDGDGEDKGDGSAARGAPEGADAGGEDTPQDG